MSWTPHATVATIIVKDNRFLMVEEIAEGKRVLNQPAGHVEQGETFEAAAIRETLEETGRHVKLTSLVGLYTIEGKTNGVTYHRLCYVAEVVSHDADYVLDSDIIRTRWLTREELVAQKASLRSPMVLVCIDDFLDNRCFPLDFVRQL
ncbi:NUDIX hydrolase [Neptunomonas antarctica]|uniref:Phosphatase NudJ n=1 Tax=Neptunomonas antarctica TaxID=619304 RepID=A0A1N7LLV9_9GAMM|nr:NUDIX hydrolase [Neptunomonas antarctica]SIS74769.1 ADP-ribose pyrophosphatase YjhB, NUDIX family [Neptunomonas antarctica]